jgi:hypothetical protein
MSGKKRVPLADSGGRCGLCKPAIARARPTNRGRVRGFEQLGLSIVNGRARDLGIGPTESLVRTCRALAANCVKGDGAEARRRGGHGGGGGFRLADRRSRTQRLNQRNRHPRPTGPAEGRPEIQPDSLSRTAAHGGSTPMILGVSLAHRAWPDRRRRRTLARLNTGIGAAGDDAQCQEYQNRKLLGHLLHPGKEEPSVQVPGAAFGKDVQGPRREAETTSSPGRHGYRRLSGSTLGCRYRRWAILAVFRRPRVARR